jgi:tetratricopeptide (TPR) repeat protein
MPAADWSGPRMSERVMACFVAAIVGLLIMGQVVSAQDAAKERAITPVSDANGMPASIQDNAQEQKLLEQLAGARKANNKRQEVGVLGELGLFYFQNGQFKKSETQYLQVLELGPKVLGANHPDIARANANLGFLYEQTNDFRKAEPVLHKAMAILGKSRRDDGCLAKVLGALGDLYYAKGDFAKADQYYGRSLAMFQRLGVNAGENIRIQDNRRKLHKEMQHRGRAH